MTHTGLLVDAPDLSRMLYLHRMGRTVKKMFPEDETMRLPSRPMRRHHYVYGRNRCLSNPVVLAGLASLHRELAAEQARELGLMDPEGPGSWTHPDLGRMLYSDGKVITPLYKGRLGDEWVDKKTGEIKQRRYEPDADLHFEGTGETAYGTKFVMVVARSEEIRGRIILDMEWVQTRVGRPRWQWAASGACIPSCREPRASSTTRRCGGPPPGPAPGDGAPLLTQPRQRSRRSHAPGPTTPHTR
jgi:hypothetical protein